MNYTENMHINSYHNRRIIGNIAEKFVCEYLIKKGYRIIEKNYRAQVGEIDIIAYYPQNDCLVFVEVKYRKNDFYGLPQEAVTKTKQDKIIKTAMIYLKQTKIKYNNYRFDVLAVFDNNKIDHIENAFMI